MIGTLCESLIINCIPNKANNDGNVTAFSFGIAWCSYYYFDCDTSSGSIRFVYEFVYNCFLSHICNK